MKRKKVDPKMAQARERQGFLSDPIRSYFLQSLRLRKEDGLQSGSYKGLVDPGPLVLPVRTSSPLCPCLTLFPSGRVPEGTTPFPSRI